MTRQNTALHDRIKTEFRTSASGKMEGDKNKLKSDKMKKPNNWIGAFICFLATIAVNCIALKCSNDHFVKSQQAIIAVYERQASCLDSLRQLSAKETKISLEAREKSIRKIFSDSCLSSAQGLCPQQKEAVRKYVRPYLEEVTSELSAITRMEGTNKLMQEPDLLLNEIRSLLELQFNKIQNEYEALEIWAGILTILFLVFSFYSLFKIEQQEEKSENTVKHIEELESRGYKELKSLSDEKEKIKKQFKDELNKMSALKAELDEQVQKAISDQSSKAEKSIAYFMSEQQKQFEKKINEVSVYYEQARDNLEDTITEYQNIIENIKDGQTGEK